MLERIWIKGSYLSQWLPQGERSSGKNLLFKSVLGHCVRYWIASSSFFNMTSSFFFCATLFITDSKTRSCLFSNRVVGRFSNLGGLKSDYLFLFLFSILNRWNTVLWIEFYADISWESRCYSEIKVWGHLCQILVVFEVPAQPQVKRMSGTS